MSVSISPRGVLLLPHPAYPGEVVATVEKELSSRHPSLPNHLYPLWPLPPDLGAPQSPGLVVPDGSMSVEPHAKTPSETIPPAESPAPPANLGFLPPVGPAPRQPSEVGRILKYQLPILGLGVALTQPLVLVYYTIHPAALSNPNPPIVPSVFHNPGDVL